LLFIGGDRVGRKSQAMSSASTKRPTGDDDASASPNKKVKAAAEAANAIAGQASKITTSAKAAAAGADSIPRTETPRKPLVEGGLVLVHWNVGGLNGLLNGKNAEDRKALLNALVENEKPDVIAISEHKLQQKNVAATEKDLLALLPGYSAHWAVCTAKNGYSGVVALVRDTLTPSVALDTVCEGLHEGRTITLSFDDVHAVLAYVPNSGQDLKRLDERVGTWEPAMRAHLKALGATKPVVLLGDLNVAHLDADIWNVTAKHIVKSAGCTPRERDAFGVLLSDGPYVDCFRHLWPEATGCFSYWSTRSGNQLLNRGLRLDYAVASPSLLQPDAPIRLHDCAYMKEYAPNGDHAPTLVSLCREA
jgi:exodeoxyribonuclease III